MSTPTGLPPYEFPTPPRPLLPLGAADCHAHVFGPFSRFPLVRERPYTPHEVPGERYIAMLDRLGVQYGVLVQPAAHGTDCAALVHALSLAPKRLRGIALLEADVSDATLNDLHAAGVRGARFSQPRGPLAVGSVSFDVLERLAPRLRALGWHAQVWVPGSELEQTVRRLLPLGLELVIDHMGMLDPARGVTDPHFQALLRLLSGGQIWVKLIPYRLSQHPPDYPDIAPFHRALVTANPERLLWGTDWPHVHLEADMPDTGHLADLFYAWTDGWNERRRILTQNPQALYGFG